ncbi:C3HC zinc finger-like-domain-containing protein [Lipomyces oligophaga]|uniref:C3HC zinc finger-like-domain-containing protein n=1 Tax=Lipomyces oligophaga TaxID=45792 RepID=UPI0034CEF3A4
MIDQESNSSDPDQTQILNQDRAISVLNQISQTKSATRNKTELFVYSPAKRFRRIRADKERVRRRSTQIKLKQFTSSSSIPKYCPFSRQQLLDRLQLFTDRAWTFDPSEPFSSPLLWARSGWTCIGAQTLECRLCWTRFYVDVQALQHELNRPILEMTRIRRAHKNSCLWRRRVCDEKLYGLSLPLEVDQAKSDFCSRLRTIAGYLELSAVSISDSTTLIDRPALVSYYWSLSNIQTQYTYTEVQMMTAFIIALTGWTVSDHSFTCSECFSQIQIPSDAPLQMEFDAGHRPYCPWISRQQGSSPSWKILLAILNSSSPCRISPQTAELKTDSVDLDEIEIQQDRNRKERVQQLRKLYIHQPSTIRLNIVK